MLPHAAKVWGGLALGATILDIVCDRGEPNGDTISECCRSLIKAIPGGRHVFAASCVAVPWWFYNHILSELDDRIGPTGDPRDAPTPGGLTNT